MRGDTIACAECQGPMPLRRLTECGFDYCIPCGERTPRVTTYVLSASGFKNNGAELVPVDQHFANQQHNHVRG